MPLLYLPTVALNRTELMSLQVKAYFEPESCTWTYLCADENSGDAFILDPVWVYDPVSGTADTQFIDQVLADAGEHSWSVKWVLETHVHADHMTCADLIRRKTGARIVIGRGISEVQKNFRRVYNMPEFAADTSAFDVLVKQGDRLPLGDLVIEVLETPGHTDDSVTYLVDGHAFIGDTLFSPEYGSARCDFPGGSASRLFNSVQSLYALPAETKLHLCHDYPETDEQEPRHCFSVQEMAATNKHIRHGTHKEDFVRMRQQRDSGLSLPRLILPSVQVNIMAGHTPQAEENGVSYLKIPFNTAIPDILKKTAEIT